MKEWQGPAFLFCAFSLAGTSVISARFVSGRLGTFTITAVSLSFALLFLLPLCWRKLAETIQITSAKGFFFLSLQALFGIFLFRMFLLISLLYTSTGEAGLLTGATPAITALLAMVLLKEPANGRKLAGIFSTVIGIFLIQGLSSANSLSMEHLGGNMLVLCAAACESVFNILSRVSAVKTASDYENSAYAEPLGDSGCLCFHNLFSLVATTGSICNTRRVQHSEMLYFLIRQRKPISPLVQTTIVTAIALLLCLIPTLFEKPVPLLATAGLKAWLALIWYGLFVTALAFIFWYAGIKRCGAFTAAAFSGMMPFTAMLLAVIILGERAGWQQWSGGILVIIGMVLIGSSNVATKALFGQNLEKE